MHKQREWDYIMWVMFGPSFVNPHFDTNTHGATYDIAAHRRFKVATVRRLSSRPFPPELRHTHTDALSRRLGTFRLKQGGCVKDEDEQVLHRNIHK